MNINTLRLPRTRSVFLLLTLAHVNAEHASRAPCLIFHEDSCFYANLTAAFIFRLSHTHLLPNHIRSRFLCPGEKRIKALP